jgi:L-aminopeptidase/D-esterase-like protein
MRPLAVARIGHLGADCVARAIVRAVVHAETLGACVSYRDATAR